MTRFAEGGNLLLKPVTEIVGCSVKEYSIAYNWDECVPAQLWCYVSDGPHLVTLLVPYRGTAAPSVIVLSEAITADSTNLRIGVDQRKWHLKMDRMSCIVESE